MNIKTLSVDELKYFLDRYDIKLTDNYILVYCSDPKRKTFHDIGDFNLVTPIRKIKISKQAIDIWKERYMDDYSLIEVQNAINFLTITYRNINNSQLDNQLRKIRSKYNNTL